MFQNIDIIHQNSNMNTLIIHEIIQTYILCFGGSYHHLIKYRTSFYLYIHPVFVILNKGERREKNFLAVIFSSKRHLRIIFSVYHLLDGNFLWIL